MHNIFFGYGSLLFSTLLMMGSAVIANELFEQGYTPMGVMTWVLIFSAVFLGIGLGNMRPDLLRVSKRDWSRLFLCGLASGLYYLGYYQAFNQLGMIMTGGFLGLTPLVGLLISALILKEQLRRSVLLGMLLGLAGVISVVNVPGAHTAAIQVTGILAGLGLVLGYALFAPEAKILLQRYHFATLAWYSLILSIALFMLDPAQYWLQEAVRYDAYAWRIILIITLLINIPGFLLFIRGIGDRRVSAGAATFTAAVQPGIAAMLGFLFMDEPLLPQQMAGLILIGLACYWVFGQGKPTTPLPDKRYSWQHKHRTRSGYMTGS